MAEQINVLGGVEGVVNSDWVAKHMSDIKAMANGDEAAAERVRKAWARTYADTVKTAGTNLNKILKDANFTSDQIEALSNQLYEFKLTGKADFTDLYNSLMAVYKDTGKVLEILKQIAGTNVKLSYDYEYAELDSRNGADRADLIDMKRNGWEVVSRDKGITKLRRMKGVKAVDNSTTEGWTTPAFTNPGGTGGSSSSAKEETPWENPYDRLYNLTQRINTEIRKRNRLESEYNRLVQYGLGNASDLAKKTEQERKSLEQQKALQQQLIAERKRMLKSSTIINIPNMLAMIWQRAILSLIMIL